MAKQPANQQRPDNDLQRERSIPVRSRTRSPTGEQITGSSYYFLRDRYAAYLLKLPTGRLVMTLGTALDIRDGKIAPSPK